jgi:hypothetical protein
MRIDLRSVALVVLCTFPVIAQQQNEKPRVPKKGERIVIKGCLRGSAVEGAETMVEDAEGVPRSQEQVPSLTYRLQGDKGLLKDLKTKHDRMVVEVKGILRSELTSSGIGADVGRTRISVGVDPKSMRGSEPVPVLEATSFEGSTVSCSK